MKRRTTWSHRNASRTKPLAEEALSIEELQGSW